MELDKSTSWKTTVAGILTILATIWTGNLEFLFDGNPDTVANFGMIITQVLVGLGLISYRDNDVRSEAAGANKEMHISLLT